MPPHLIGKCFNCMGEDHIRANCVSKSCCINCGSDCHRRKDYPFPPLLDSRKRRRSPPQRTMTAARRLGSMLSLDGARRGWMTLSLAARFPLGALRPCPTAAPRPHNRPQRTPATMRSFPLPWNTHIRRPNLCRTRNRSRRNSALVSPLHRSRTATHNSLLRAIRNLSLCLTLLSLRL